ncbi:8812_t:CDS:2 [Cetraspora pellucida]|uniref:8812_t:CDS:1 n=1 Tax=Cetraspora pellucida TaxID=1433469 RepID=A0A9N8VDE0_9GLOM|nr:8812_t:CDS:2 [Cetraspora pellucida]
MTTQPETPINDLSSIVSPLYESNEEIQNHNKRKVGRPRKYTNEDDEFIPNNKISSIEVENGNIDLGITKINGKFKVVFNK